VDLRSAVNAHARDGMGRAQPRSKNAKRVGPR
jgi:hypothetical protein